MGSAFDDIFKAASAPCRPLGAWDDRAATASLRRSTPASRRCCAQAGADDSAVVCSPRAPARGRRACAELRELLSNAEPTADGFNLTAQDRIYDFRSFNWCSAQT